jgi:hypothetical protein
MHDLLMFADKCRDSTDTVSTNEKFLLQAKRHRLDDMVRNIFFLLLLLI